MTRIVVKEYELLTLSKSCNGVGVEHVGGDMFDSVPKGDAIFMKVSLYDSSSPPTHPPQKKKKKKPFKILPLLLHYLRKLKFAVDTP